MAKKNWINLTFGFRFYMKILKYYMNVCFYLGLWNEQNKNTCTQKIAFKTTLIHAYEWNSFTLNWLNEIMPIIFQIVNK